MLLRLLLQKVKADNAEIAEAERHLAEMQEAVRRGRAQLSQLATDMSEVRGWHLLTASHHCHH